MYSNSNADGTFSIAVSFELGTNLDIAQVQVQNRVGIAQPRLLESEQYAVDHRDVGKDGDDPQCRCHTIEQRADNDQNDSLGALHKPDLAGADQRLCAGSRVAHHYRAGHDYRDQNDVKEPAGTCVVNQ